MASIELRDVSLDYVIKTGSDSLKKSMAYLCQRYMSTKRIQPSPIRHSSYRALNSINLTLKSDDRLGLLGKNGAGKSTLLRVLAKVYRPSLGEIDIKGKISSLFDINLGMNVEATGYENIVNLAIMRGISKKNALAMVEDIESFTQLGDFLNRPVRTYSTGMQMKLSFAVATSIKPEIMLIDEVIGVGDMHFMDKATKRLEGLINQSHILALTSHSTDTIKRFCNRVVVLDRGEVQFFGDVATGIDYYQNIPA
jgi:ABC-type polysaccharide/polyol phosphate transport system ATPase subunit